MFHFPTFPPHTLYIQMQVTRHHSCWVSPFGNPRISARLTAPRGLSQPPTSFIGSWCQGIHRTLLHTYKQRCSRPLCSSQTTHPHRIEFKDLTGKPAVSQETRADRFDFLERNTRVFFQDPTVCRYIPANRPCDRLECEELVSVPPMSSAGLHVSPKRLCQRHIHLCELPAGDAP
jgi:hypothetical protein